MRSKPLAMYSPRVLFACENLEGACSVNNEESSDKVLTFEFIPYDVTCAGTDCDHRDANSIISALASFLFLQ